jgi:hypothetical protein
MKRRQKQTSEKQRTFMLLIQADEEEEVDVMVRRPRMAVVSPERGR